MTSLLRRLEQLELESKTYGFYWENASQVLQQIISECDEIREHLEPNHSSLPVSTLEEEVGDLLHAAFSLCVFCKLNPEQTLTKAIDKFEKRYRRVQQLAQQQGLSSLQGLSFKALMDLWHQAKMSSLENVQTNTLELSWALDPNLFKSCFVLADWPLSQVLLKNNSEYPWFILVPRRQDISELIQLSATDQTQLMFEINRLCEVIHSMFHPDKLNMGALGNMVQQFHYHVIARFKHDDLWPQGVWQQAVIERPYAEPQALIERLQSALAR
jgi:diadenosine tetraphosphate (Ap4A) HIT family hydrolase